MDEISCLNCKHLIILNKTEATLLDVEFDDDNTYVCTLKGNPKKTVHQISGKEKMVMGNTLRCVDVFHQECKGFKTKERGSRYGIRNEKKRKPEEKPFMGVELFKFIDTCKTMRQEERILFLMLFWTGRRIAELIGVRNSKSNAIKKEQINFKDGILKNIKIVKKRNAEVVVNNPLPSELVEDLADYIQNMEPDEVLFKRSYFEYRYYFNKFFKDHTIHDIRASFAIFQYNQNNNDILVVKELLKHSSSAITEIYLRGIAGENFEKTIRKSFEDFNRLQEQSEKE